MLVSLKELNRFKRFKIKILRQGGKPALLKIFLNINIFFIKIIMQIKTVGIIGGQGKMGAYFVNFFGDLGYEVLVSDVETELTNQQLTKRSDLVIVSVPINQTVRIINSVVNEVREDSIICDVTSIKSPVVEAMLRTKARDIVGMHPMFGPTTSIVGQVVILTPGRGEQGLNFLRDIFEKAQAKVKIILADKHDRLMTVIQGLTHFTDITLARALSRTGIEIHEFLEYQSPSYRLRLVMMGRILAQDSRLYGNMQIENPNTLETLGIFQEAAEEFIGIVKDKDLKAFESYFDQSAAYLQDFSQTAMEESERIIEDLFQKKNYDKGVNPLVQKKNLGLSIIDKACNFKVLKQISKKRIDNIAILGPANTYSDFACTQAFGKEKLRQYYNTITEVFERVSSGDNILGLVPAENKIAGGVSETYNAFWNYDDIVIIKELDLRINHVLVGEGSIDIRKAKRVYSHSSALNQCSNFLLKYKNLQKVAVPSTAEAANNLDEESLAIVPRKAALQGGLVILGEKITNNDDNFTRFYLIKKREEGDLFSGVGQSVRTSLAFRLYKTKSHGSLLKILEFFAGEEINLLKLESKPIGERGDIVFFVDVEGGMNEEQIFCLSERVEVLKVFGVTEGF